MKFPANTIKGFVIFSTLFLLQCSRSTNVHSQSLEEVCTVPPTYQEPTNTSSLKDATRDYSNYLPVFPGAQGFGTITPAGRGPNPCKNAPEVVVVSNLNSNGKGSLRAALEGNWQKPRFVVFTVGGTIDLATNGKHQAINITSPYVTIAGQTAPSPGITLKNGTLRVMTNNVLIQHLRIRPGDTTCVGNGDCDTLDGLNIYHNGSTTNPVYNVVIDHSSISWGVDENIGTWADNSKMPLRDITVSNSIISEGLDGTMHSKGQHSKGLLVGDYTKRFAIIGNLFAHNRERNPMLKGDTSALVANNLIYDQGFSAISLFDGLTSFPILASIVSNVVVPGPDSPMKYKGLYVKNSVQPGTKVFLSDNEWNWQKGGSLSQQWSTFVNDQNPDVNERVDTAPTWVTPFNQKQVSQVRSSVLDHAGAFPRDNNDARIIAHIRNCSQANDTESCLGGLIKSSPTNAWPTSKTSRSLQQAAIESNCSLPAADKYWLDKDRDGYTNFEEWLHAMAAYVEKGQKCGSM